MALLGQGALVFWHDITPGQEGDYKAWHSHEHMIERLRVPGFLRGRRAVAETDGPHYLIAYEVETPATLTSQPYLDRVNDPSPWTRRAIAHFTNTNRTIFSVAASFGVGVGAELLTIRFSPEAGKTEALRDWLAGSVLPGLATTPGLTGAHLLFGDADASQTDTDEKRIRGRPDDIADWALIVEGYDRTVAGLTGTELSAERLCAHGAAATQRIDRFLLEHCLTATDVAG